MPEHTGPRPGRTTGAGATAATTAAYTALLTGGFPGPVAITLPKGRTPSLALAAEELTGATAMTEWSRTRARTRTSRAARRSEPPPGRLTAGAVRR
ncbi:cobalt-precorrin-5B (C(1))-methyltransferase [Streptomyces sp. NEAU-NA10]|uniref:cobalt-precorrin-5B (C(1))-methyltransferase n=1 Tax=Streptomyces sp. NEAU-NA10 TaxID=3416050 RepID=UPI003CC5E362